MNRLKSEIATKLNVTVELVKHCAAKAVPTNNHNFMQEVTLAAITHEGLCKLFEQDGPTKNVTSLVNDFGNVIAELYNTIVTFKPQLMTKTFHSKKLDKNLLN